jgi:hypothetical protein
MAATTLPVLMAGGCGKKHLDTYGRVTEVTASRVCISPSGAAPTCVSDLELLAKRSDTLSVGDCARLRLIPESSGAATLRRVGPSHCE